MAFFLLSIEGFKGLWVINDDENVFLITWCALWGLFGIVPSVAAVAYMIGSKICFENECIFIGVGILMFFYSLL